jgi:hypothetical protein
MNQMMTEEIKENEEVCTNNSEPVNGVVSKKR